MKNFQMHKIIIIIINWKNHLVLASKVENAKEHENDSEPIVVGALGTISEKRISKNCKGLKRPN